jgi:Pyruvate/2-oxoacid:ferredoxin oxidoreductase delta subunit
MSRPIWFVNLLKRSFAGRFLAARATNLPGLGNLAEHMLFEGDDLLYLPRERTIQIHAPIAKPENIVLPSQVVTHFIEHSNYHWIMNRCICRDSSHCQDFPIEYGCIFLGEATQGINPALGHPVTKDEALAHAQRCREVGLVHLIGRNKLDMVWLGVSPGEKLLTICNCCPCCCLWKMLPLVNPSIGDKVSKLPGVTVTITDLCKGCGDCTQGVCFVDAIHLVDGNARISQACRGCGRCIDVCSNDAIKLSIEGRDIYQQAITRLETLVDLT